MTPFGLTSTPDLEVTMHPEPIATVSDGGVSALGTIRNDAGSTRIEQLRWAVENRRSVVVDSYLISVWEAHHLVAYYDAIPEWNQYLFEGDPLPDVLALAIRYGESQDVA